MLPRGAHGWDLNSTVLQVNMSDFAFRELNHSEEPMAVCKRYYFRVPHYGFVDFGADFARRSEGPPCGLLPISSTACEKFCSRQYCVGWYFLCCRQWYNERRCSSTSWLPHPRIEWVENWKTGYMHTHFKVMTWSSSQSDDDLIISKWWYCHFTLLTSSSQSDDLIISKWWNRYFKVMTSSS